MFIYMIKINNNNNNIIVICFHQMEMDDKGKERKWDVLDVVNRAMGIAITLAAAILMATNKQTTMVPLGVVNNVPVIRPIAAKFNYTPAFVFLVVANGVACGYGVLSLLVSIANNISKSGGHSNFPKFVVALLDLVVVALLSAASSAAAAIGDMGRRGNSHTGWKKICDKYGHFCNRSGAAIMVSFSGVGIFMLLCSLSTYRIYKRSLH
eukprot:Gb_11696 [translate_table: standard]